MRKKKLLSLLLVGAQLAALISTAALPSVASASSPTDQVLDFVHLAKTTKYVGSDYDVTVDNSGITITLTNDVTNTGEGQVSCNAAEATTVIKCKNDLNDYGGMLNASTNGGAAVPGEEHYVMIPGAAFNIDNNPYLHAKITGAEGNSTDASWSFGLWYLGLRTDKKEKLSARYSTDIADSLGAGTSKNGNFIKGNLDYHGTEFSNYMINNDRTIDFKYQALILKVCGKKGDSFTISQFAFGPKDVQPAKVYEMTAPKVASAPTIDANLSDWGTLTQDMAEGAQGKDQGKFDVKHDNDFVYIAAQISNHTGTVTPGSGWTVGDCISVYFDPTMHRGELNNSIYDLQLGYGYNASGTPTLLFGGSPNSDVQNEIKNKGAAKCASTSDGWILEVKIPKTALHLVNPYLGFDIQSENNENSTFINWTDGKDFYMYTTDYGKLTLAQDPATSLTTEIKSLDIPLNTTKELTDVTFLLNGKETINASYYAMNITFEPAGIIAIEKGRFVGKKAGTTNITFKVDEKSVTIPATCKAIALITIDPIGDQEAYVGIEKSFTIKATASAPTTLVYAATSLPRGASFDPDTHVFKWAPEASQIGDHTATFTVSDKDSTKTLVVKITVKETPSITVDPISDKTVAAGKAVSFLFNATDSLGLPLTAECTNLPTGARFSTNSDKFFFTWIPTKEQIGTYTLNFVFTNGSTSTPATVNIKVVDKIVDGISFDPISDKSIEAGDTVSFKVNATSSDSQPVSITTSSSLPSGATFNTESNTFTWATSSSTSSGSYPITFRATAGDFVATLTVVIDVTNSNNNNNSSSGGSYGGGYGYVGSVAGTTTGTDTTAQQSKYFKDMVNHLWASASVDTLYEYGIVKGITADTYGPERNISRADFVLLLMRTFNFSGDASTNFSDVSASAYYAKEVAIARNVGLVNGSGNNQFNPTAAISRQDMMVMLNRALQIAGLAALDANDYVISNYDDTANIAPYATQAVANMVSANLVAGTDNMLKPMANTTRAEIAVILHRMLQKYGTALVG